MENLQARIANPTIGVAKGFPSTTDLQLAAMEAESAHAQAKGGKGPPGGAATAAARGGGGANDGFGGVGPGGGLGAISAQLPFELRVLEICLDEISNFFELLVTELEGAVSPVLESLTTKVRVGKRARRSCARVSWSGPLRAYRGGGAAGPAGEGRSELCGCSGGGEVEACVACSRR